MERDTGYLFISSERTKMMEKKSKMMEIKLFTHLSF